jgi:hypothetical protein
VIYCPLSTTSTRALVWAPSLRCIARDEMDATPLLSSSHESVRANALDALMHDRDSKGPGGPCLSHCREWMLCRSQPVFIRLDVKGESVFPLDIL